MPTYEQVRRHVVARERKKDEQSSDPQGLPFLKPTIGVSRFLHQPEKRIRSVDAQVDERFGAPVVVKPHHTEHNWDDQSLVCIDIDDDFHSVIRFPSGMAPNKSLNSLLYNSFINCMMTKKINGSCKKA